MSPCSCTINPRSLKMSLISVMSAWTEEHKEKNGSRGSCVHVFMYQRHAAVMLWTFDSYSYLQLPDGRLSLLNQPQVIFSDGLGLSLQLGVTARTNLDAIRTIRITFDIIMTSQNDNNQNNQKQWAYFENGVTYPKLSSGWPPCWRKQKLLGVIGIFVMPMTINPH